MEITERNEKEKYEKLHLNEFRNVAPSLRFHIKIEAKFIYERKNVP